MSTAALAGNALRDRVQTTLGRLSRSGAFPMLPGTASAALAVARDPDADIDELCNVARTDVGLSARLLRVANSAAYARRATATTLQEAVVTLGLKKSCDLLVASCARELYQAPSAAAPALWAHALAVALAAEDLAKTTRRVPVASAFLPGLFHDVGRIAFLLADASSFEVIHDLVRAGEGDGVALEAEWYGFAHDEAGAILAENWGLPADQADAIRWHHDPAAAGAGRDLAAVLSAADAIAYAIGFGTAPERPASVGGAALGLSADDEAACADRVREAFERQSELLG